MCSPVHDRLTKEQTIDFVAAVREVANNNQKQFKKYASGLASIPETFAIVLMAELGRQGVLGFFVGQILRQHSMHSYSISRVFSLVTRQQVAWIRRS